MTRLEWLLAFALYAVLSVVIGVTLHHLHNTFNGGYFFGVIAGAVGAYLCNKEIK